MRATLPQDLQMLEADPTPERLRSRLSWSLAELPAGQHRLLRLVVKTPPKQPLRSLPVSVAFRAEASVECPVCPASLSLQIDAPPTATVGVPTTLRLTVANQGANDLAGVVVRTALPPSLTHASGAELENEISRLRPGQTVTIPLALVPTRAGPAVVRASISHGASEPCEREAAVEVREDRMQLAVHGTPAARPGEACQYRFTAGNGEPGGSAPARLVAHLPDGIAFVRASDGGTYEASTHSVVWDLGELASGTSRAVSLQGVARQAGAQEGRIVLTGGMDRIKQRSWTTRIGTQMPAPPGP